MKIVLGRDVFNSPEFNEFCRRFGIATELPTRRMTITIDLDGALSVQQEYLGTDNKKAFDVTTSLSKEYREYQSAE